MKQFFLLFILTLYFCNLVFATKLAEKGKIYISKKDISEGIIKLDGEWEIYYNRLLSPGEIEFNTEPSQLIEYPILIDKKYPGKGKCNYATLKLNLYSEVDTVLRLYIGEIRSSYKVWLNRTLLGENGKVSKDKETGKPSSTSLIKLVKINEGDNILVLQIANHFHRNIGSIKSIKIGDELKISNSILLDYVLDMFIFGALLIMAIYHLILFFIHRKDIASLVFGVYLLLISFRTLSTGEKLLFVLLPDFSWELNLKLEYLSFYFGVPLVMAFFHLMYKKLITCKIPYIIYVVSTVFSIIVIFSPPAFFVYSLEIYQIYAVLCIIYLMFLVVKIFKTREKGAIPIVIATIILFYTVINDILYIHTTYINVELVSFGMLIFILAQSYIIAQKFSIAFEQNKSLTKKLDLQNKNLEGIVEERTQEIVVQKKELEKKNLHITDSIEYAKKIQTAMLPEPESLNEHIKDSFVLYLPKDIVSGDFYWTSNVNNLKIFAVGDSTGHGVPGAFMSILGLSFLKDIVDRLNETEPDKILTLLRQNIIEALRQNMENHTQNDGIDMSVAIYNRDTNEISLSIANSKVYVVSSGELKEYKGNKTSVSFSKKMNPFPKFVFQPQKDSIMYMFTDGIIDQFKEKTLEKFKTGRLKKEFLKIHKLPMQKQNESLHQTFINWKGSLDQIDDVLVMGIKF